MVLLLHILGYAAAAAGLLFVTLSLGAVLNLTPEASSLIRSSRNHNSEWPPLAFGDNRGILPHFESSWHPRNLCV